MEADGALFTFNLLVPYARVIRIHNKPFIFETGGEFLVVL
jgi:hypothetical protein